MSSDTAWLTRRELGLIWKLTFWLWIAVTILFIVLNTLSYLFGATPPSSVWDYIQAHFIGLPLVMACLAVFFFIAVTIGTVFVKAIRRAAYRDVMKTKLMEDNYNKMRERNKNW